MGEVPPTRKIHTSTLCLLLIGLTDLVVTLMWLNAGHQEGNPLFAALAAHGSIAFAAGKLAFLFGPIALLEYVRTKRPQSAEQGTWIAVMFYLLLLGRHSFEMFGSPV